MEHNLDIVDELFKTLKALQPLKPEDQARLDKKFRLEFNYNSNHIEGNTLTYGETELLLMFDDTKGNHSMREYEEMKAHDLAYHMIEQWAEDSEHPLTEQTIKELNEIILVRPYWKEAITPDGQNTRRQIKVGNYKEFPNSVRLQNGEMFDYASPIETPILMRELIDWYQEHLDSLNPIALATILHYKFVCIHPFDDGNGRVARLIMNYVFIKSGYPPVIIKSADKNNYLRALRRADVGEHEYILDYVAEQLQWSLKTAIKAAKGELLEENHDFKKELELIKRKASTKVIAKSPKIAYDSFHSIQNTIWVAVLDTLTHFDALFNETRDSCTFNSLPEIFEKKSILNLNAGLIAFDLLNQTDKPKELKIFGHNVYDSDVRTLRWRHNMYGLNGADVATNVVISLMVTFSNLEYKVRLEAGTTVVYEINRRYKDSFQSADIDKITDALKKCLIEFIKTKID
jgi:Fic family protein